MPAESHPKATGPKAVGLRAAAPEETRPSVEPRSPFDDLAAGDGAAERDRGSEDLSDDGDRGIRPTPSPNEPHDESHDGPDLPLDIVISAEAAVELNSRAARASNTQLVRKREAEEDRVLIAQAQTGDRVAFRQLVERHQRRAFAIALSLVRDENDARELVQDAFLRVFRNLGSFQGSSSFFTWLYRIITNLSIDLLRKPGRQVLDFDERAEHFDEASPNDFPLLGRFAGADPHDAVRSSEIKSKLEEALAALPEYHRAVILLREVEGMSYEEIAESMGVSKGTIMSRLFHARQKLQRALADCYTEQVGVPDATHAELLNGAGQVRVELHIEGPLHDVATSTSTSALSDGADPSGPSPHVGLRMGAKRGTS